MNCRGLHDPARNGTQGRESPRQEAEQEAAPSHCPQGWLGEGEEIMARNRRPQNRHTPYRIEVAGKHTANFAKHPFGLIRWCREKNVYYRLFHNDQLVDEA